MTLQRVSCVVLAVAAGCASSAGNSNVRVRAPLTGAAHCVEVRARAKANPALDVEKLPAPVKQPRRLLAGPFPAGVIGEGGYADVHTTVVVDTLGKPVMKSFRVRTASHPWLGEDVKRTIAQWTFSPAELEGCRVARVYRVDATSGRR